MRPDSTTHTALTALLACALVAGCAEQKVVRYKPMLAGLPGAETQTPVTGTPGYIDPTYVPQDKLSVEDPVTKKKTLTAKTCKHLMIHIYNTMKANDKQTFVREVLSSKTKAECSQRGVDPGETFDELLRRQDDVLALFNAMPMGESTPGAYIFPLGKKEQRVELQGLAAKDLAWTGIDMIFENGNWKLRWFYSPGE
jgi:hypothetical protein